jgi:hypothetical protein
MTRKDLYVWQPMNELPPGKGGEQGGEPRYHQIPGTNRRIAVYNNGHVDIEMDRVESDGDKRTRPREPQIHA